MIQLSALPTPGTAASGDEAAIAAQAGAAQGADFSALLAIEVVAAPPAAAQPLPEGTPTTLPAMVAVPANALPEGGKTLPVALQVTLPVAAELAEVPQDEPAAQPGPPVAAPLHAALQALALRVRPAKAEGKSSDETPVEPQGEAAPEAAPAKDQTVATLTIAAAPLLAQPVPVEAPAPEAKPGRAVLAAAAPQVSAQPARPQAAPRMSAPVPQVPAATLTPIAPAAELAPVANLTVTPASMAVTLTEPTAPRLALSTPVQPVPVSLEDETSSEMPLTLAPQQSAFAAPLQSAPAVAAPQTPHDFAALVDRIAAARDASGAGVVSVSVAHSDFGQVQLRFHQHDGALSVGMASADPDFARAISAAPPLVQAAGASAETTNQFSPQGGRSESNASQAGTGQRGSAQGERRDGQQPSTNPTPQRARRSGGESDHGIFA